MKAQSTDCTKSKQSTKHKHTQSTNKNAAFRQAVCGLCFRYLCFICVLVPVFCVFVTANVFAESQGKIGYIDLSRSFDEYEKTKDFDKELEKKGDIKQEAREKLVKEIRKMREELELMNKDSREKKEVDIEANIKSLQEFDQEAKTDLTKERDNMVRDILKEMSDVIKEYGQKNGYSIILNDRVLLYGDSTMDITNEIIKVLNENYNAASQAKK